MTELADDVQYDDGLERVVDVGLPTTYGTFRAIGYLDVTTGQDHVALVYGNVIDQPALTRVHSECLTGDVFGSTRCECGEQLAAALRAIVADGAGVLIYLQGHEGRGIGLLAKLKAMRLQEQGLDTVEANLALGLPVDSRDYRPAAWMLRDIGVRSIRLLSNNPDKFASLWRSGIRVVERVPLLVTPNKENLQYLRTKRERLNHLLPHLDGGASSAESTPANDSTRLPSTSPPFSAEASEGRPTTPDAV